MYTNPCIGFFDNTIYLKDQRLKHQVNTLLKIFICPHILLIFLHREYNYFIVEALTIIVFV